MSNRKPYVREMKRTWWNKHSFYRFYMLREATVIPLILFTLFLTYGLISLANGTHAWLEWLEFMKHPLVIIINLIALAGSLFHAATFFSMFPQVMPIRIGGKLVDSKLLIIGQWIAMAVISIIVLILV